MPENFSIWKKKPEMWKAQKTLSRIKEDKSRDLYPGTSLSKFWNSKRKRKSWKHEEKCDSSFTKETQ